MATQGPLFPSAVTTAAVAPENANDWVSPGNISADDGAEAQITAASYDSPDISFRLVAQGFGFSIPGGSTIDGITVEIERRAFAGGAEDERVQLIDAAGLLVGDNKAVVDPDWPTTATIRTYGGAADTWTASPTVTMVNDPDFGVVLSVQATTANADIGVDFIRVTITYTEPTGQEQIGQAALATTGVLNSVGALLLAATAALSASGLVSGTATVLTTHEATASLSSAASVLSNALVNTTHEATATLSVAASVQSEGSLGNVEHLAFADLLTQATLLATTDPPIKTCYVGKVYTVSTMPIASFVSAGSVIFVSDAPAGEKFKGYDGAAWVNLG